MPYLLNIIYLTALIIASPWMLYRSICTGRYRNGWIQRLFGQVPQRNSATRPSIWVHAVSVGEVQLLRTLVPRLIERFPEHDVVVSTTTLTGMQLARTSFPHQIVFYCPMDFTWAVRRCLRRLQPSMLILAELELWPNLIGCAKASGCKVIVVNGRLSERSYHGYYRLRFLFTRVLRKLDLVAVQDATYAERFLKLGVSNDTLHVTGSMKFDGAEFDRSHPEILRLREAVSLGQDDLVWVVGSTQSPEEQYAIDAYQQLIPEFPNLRLILVPRHPERGHEVASLLQAARLTYVRRAGYARETLDLGDSGTARSSVQSPSVVLVDVVGELRWWWGLANLAFVGGSFGKRGGQNMIEPAAFGVCTSFGPNTRHFRDIVQQFVDAHAVTILNEPIELVSWVRTSLHQADQSRSVGDRARQVVMAHRGATERTVNAIAWLVTDERKHNQIHRAASTKA